MTIQAIQTASGWQATAVQAVGLPVIVVDTRERRGWDFPGAVSRKLEAGDYSVNGLEHLVAVERKSLDDLVQTLTRARDRFFREAKLLARRRFAAIVVEAGLPDLMAGRYASDVSPAGILGTCMSLHVDWGIPVVWAGDRGHARLWTERFLTRASARLQPGDRTPSAVNNNDSGQGEQEN